MIMVLITISVPFHSSAHSVDFLDLVRLSVVDDDVGSFIKIQSVRGKTKLTLLIY